MTYEQYLDAELAGLRKHLLDEAKIDKLLGELREMLIAKHHDYGVDNLLGFGEFGILVRSSDKVNRLKHTLQYDSLVPETGDDTWRDLAGYAVQALILRRGGIMPVVTSDLPISEGV